MARFSVFLDACVLVPMALADLLLRLAEAELYRPLWSQRVLDEMVYAIEQARPTLPPGKAAARAVAMNEAFNDACVEGWERVKLNVDLPDANDAHVVAAALRGRADMIVTANLADFPSSVLAALGLEVQHPDDFLLSQLDLEPEVTMMALENQARATKKPAITERNLLEHLKGCGVPRFAKEASQQLAWVR